MKGKRVKPSVSGRSQTYDERAASSGRIAMVLRFSPEERAALETLANGAGKSMRDFLGDLLLGLYRTTPR